VVDVAHSGASGCFPENRLRDYLSRPCECASGTVGIAPVSLLVRFVNSGLSSPIARRTPCRLDGK